jgi:hypothetical protein
MPSAHNTMQVHSLQGDLAVSGSRMPVGVLPLLQEGTAHPDDIFILNFGLWHGQAHKKIYKASFLDFLP